MTAVDLWTPAERTNGKGGPEDFARMVRDRWDQGGEELAKQRREYWINLAFYLGEQWLWWNRERNMIDSLPQDWSPLGPGKACVTVNRLGANHDIVMGRMLASNLTFEVPPTDSAASTVQGSRKAEKVMEHYHREQYWESVRHDQVADSFYGGTSGVLVEWDGAGGKPLQYNAQEDRLVGTGDAYLTPLNTHEFVLGPVGTRRADLATYLIVGVAVPCSVAKDQYKLSYMPQSDTSALSTPLQRILLENMGRPAGRDICLVLTYYERPNRGRPGRYGIVIGDKTVHQGEWPFPFDTLPFFAFRQRRVPNKPYGTTFLNDAVQLQFLYNHARSALTEHMKLVGNAKLMAPQGAFQPDDFTNDIDVLWYQPDSTGAEPKYLLPAQLARWVSAEPEALRAELDEIQHVHDVSRGQGFDRASGQALALLSEKDDTPLGMMATEEAHGWGYIASLVLKLLEAKGRSTRRISIRVMRGITETVDFTGKMLQGQTTVIVPKESTTPRTQAANIVFWKDLWDRKIITDPRVYARGVGLPSDEFEELLEPDAAKAWRENYLMVQGSPEMPDKRDDHAKHMAEHLSFVKTDAYKYATEDVQSIIDDHLKFHEMLVHEELISQTQRASTNPMLAAMPQANDPQGAYRAPTFQEQQTATAMGAGQDGSGGGGPQLGAGGTTPALAAGMMG